MSKTRIGIWLTIYIYWGASIPIWILWMLNFCYFHKDKVKENLEAILEGLWWIVVSGNMEHFKIVLNRVEKVFVEGGYGKKNV